MIPRHAFAALCTALFTIGGPSLAHALNVDEHRVINEVAASTEAFDLRLRNQLGLLRGLSEPFVGQRAIQWLGLGGEREDDVFFTTGQSRFRPLRHFHDPLTKLGLKGEFESSVRWMQRTDQGYSYQNARAFYLAALTSTTTIEREAAWANTFRAVGQVMHLVVDAAGPEHVRDDAHPRELICRKTAVIGIRCGTGNYEYWVSDERVRNEDAFIATYLSSPIGFDPAILQRPTYDPQAPVAIANLIDTNTYRGAATGPNITLSPVIGVAEFTNANFFSEDTHSGEYPFPNLATLVRFEATPPAGRDARAYFGKGAGDGLPVAPVLAECVYHEIVSLEFGVVEDFLRNCVDEFVWAATAREALPRAIGYARGALEFFFRGTIEIAPPNRYAYGLALFQDGNAGNISSLRFKVRNATANNEETRGTGVMFAVVRYRRPAGNVIDNPGVALSPPIHIVSEGKQVALSRDFTELEFDFSQNPLPVNSADLFLTAVYVGQLGEEQEAIMVGSKDLFEPDPIDRFNITDYDCPTGQPIQVSNLPKWAVDPTKRDLNGDRVQDLFGPWTEGNVLLKTFDARGPIVFASPSNFDLFTPQFTFAQFQRLIVIQDSPVYGLSALRQYLVEFSNDAVVFNPPPEATFIRGIQNRVFVDANGQLRRVVNPSGLYRGVSTFHFFLVVSSNNVFGCLPATETLPPVLTQTPRFLP